jgi:hypothetical protein
MLCSSHLLDSSAASTASILAGVLVFVVGRSAGSEFDDGRGSYMICAAISAIRQPRMMVTMSSLVTEVLAFLRCSLLSRLHAYVGHVVSTFVLDALRWAAAAVLDVP